jgi:hypothetical protein
VNACFHWEEEVCKTFCNSFQCFQRGPVERGEGVFVEPTKGVKRTIGVERAVFFSFGFLRASVTGRAVAKLNLAPFGAEFREITCLPYRSSSRNVYHICSINSGQDKAHDREGHTKLQGRTRGRYTSSGTTNIGDRYTIHSRTKSRGSSSRSPTRSWT